MPLDRACRTQTSEVPDNASALLQAPSCEARKRSGSSGNHQALLTARPNNKSRMSATRGLSLRSGSRTGVDVRVILEQRLNNGQYELHLHMLRPLLQ